MLSCRNTDLVEAMEKAMDFHGLLTELLSWIAEAEERAAKYEPMPGASSTDIRNEVKILSFSVTSVNMTKLGSICSLLCYSINTLVCFVQSKQDFIAASFIKWPAVFAGREGFRKGAVKSALCRFVRRYYGAAVCHNPSTNQWPEYAMESSMCIAVIMSEITFSVPLWACKIFFVSKNAVTLISANDILWQEWLKWCLIVDRFSDSWSRLTMQPCKNWKI